MKKIILGVLIIGIVAAAFILSRSGGDKKVAQNSSLSSGGSDENKMANENQSSGGSRNELLGQGDNDANSDLTDEGIEEQEARPAYEVYQTASEALEALEKGAKDYDDLILEQFTNLGPDCQWCDSLYSSVREKMISKDTSSEQRSYYAEVLAISGRLENIESLIEQIKEAKGEDAEVYAEALELAVGDDKIVKYLSDQLSTENPTLKEASVAALTNQGSRLAVESLFKHVIERGDPDGYYSQGYGPGEQIPDEEALPFVQEYVAKRDAYSRLAAMQLLNNGVDGLRRLLDLLENSNDPAFDIQMVKGLEAHVPYEESAETMLKNTLANSKSEAAKQLAEKTLADFNIDSSGQDDENE